ncbi:MAG: hypothetical protein U0871_08030 [Gemmataceae bacterium]
MSRTLAGVLAVTAVGLAAADAIGGDIGFVEDFALAKDRPAALRQLIPGTEDYYYYHALHYLNTEQWDKAEEITKPWLVRFGQTARLTEVQTRFALLTYNRDPKKSLEYLKAKLGLRFDHQREVLGAAPDLPTRFDNARITRAALLADSLRRPTTEDNFEDSALDWLAAEKPDSTRIRLVLTRLTRPDVPGLPKLIADDLAVGNHPGFGAFTVHRLLTLVQLEELLKLRPELLNQSRFVQTYLPKLHPGADEDWRHDPARTRAYLDRLLAFARRLNGTHNSLKAHVLYHKLVLDRSEGKYDEALFREYLEVPRRQEYVTRSVPGSPYFREHPADPHDRNAQYVDFTLLPPVGNDEPLVRDYLKHFLAAADSPKAYTPLIDSEYLKRLFAETKIELGLGEPERWASDLPPEDFKALRERIDIDFAPTNPARYGVDQPVRLDLFVKNVPSLLVKVYEVNTVNFYRDRQREVDTDIPLDGLVANSEQTHTLVGDPLRRVARRFDFPQLTKPGVYVIDFIGAGRSSRALVRKGRLRPLVTTTPNGQSVVVVDEQNRPVPDATLLFGGKEYTPDKDGRILVPFSTSPGRQPVVLKRGEFASLDSLDHQPENYSLVAGIHVPREALLSQRVAKVLIRPGVYLNGRPTSVRLLEEPALRITATDIDGIQTTTEVPNVRLFEDRETTHEVRVPPRLARLDVLLRAKVKSLTTGQPVELAAGDSFGLNGMVKTDKIEDLHLAKFGSEYVVELLGRTGEPKPDRAVQVSVKHRDFKQPVHATLKTDARGRVALGQLADIVSVTATGPEGTAHTWTLPRDQSTYRRTVNARPGKPVVIPYPATGDKATRDEVALFEVVGELTRALMTVAVQRPDGHMETRVVPGGTITADRFEAVAVADGQLELRGLTPGDYDLYLKRANERIRVRVVDGPEADGFALGAVRHLELPKLKPVRIASVTADDAAVTVRLKDASKFARVHVIATRYVPAYGPFDRLSRVRDAELTAFYPGFAPSVYLTGRNIGDEYRYVLDRKGARKFPGNMLDRPQLLLNPWAVRTTETGEQLAAEGGQFGGVGGAVPPAASPASPAMDPKSQSGRPDADPTAFAFLDFLGEPAVVLDNLVPNADGVVTVDRKQLGAHGFVQVFAVDPLHTTTRTLALPEPAGKFDDLRLMAGLDPKGHFTQQKRVSVLPTGQPFVLADAAGGRFEAYDSLARVYGLFRTLSNDPKLTEFGFVLTWPTLKPELKRELYSKYACHELNVFLMKKDPPFFESVVKPYLANKKDKTFVDRWLIGDGVEGYAEPWRYGRLNTAERVMLSRRLPGEGPKTARHLGDLLKLLPPNPDRERTLFETSILGRGLDASDELGKSMLRMKAMNAAEKPGMPMAAEGSAAGLGAMPAPGGPPGAGGPAGGGGFGAGGFGAGRGGRPGAPKGEARRERESLQRDGAAKKDAEAKSVEEFDKLGELSDDAKRKAAGDRADFFYRRDAGNIPIPLFRKVDPTQEWAENNYYKLLITQQTADLVTVSPFWLDYANHDGQGPFLSTHVAAASRNFTEMMLALAVLDLPFEAAKAEMAFDAGKMTYTPKGPTVAFVEEVRPSGAPGGKLPVLVSQNVYKHGDRYRDENGERLDKFVTDEFVVQTVYGSQVVVTNPGPSPQRLSVLIQIPTGAVPVAGGQPTRSVLLSLNPYQTQTVDTLFYFPKPGRFAQFPAHVAKNETLVAAANPATFEVVATPSKLDTGSWDYVSQNGTSEEVLAFLDRENVHALNLDRIAFRLKDRGFFEKVTALLAARHAYSPTLWSYALLHNDAAVARQYLLHNDQLANETGGPLSSPLLTVNPVDRFTYEHLEYKPLVNARAHALGHRRQIVNDRLHAQYHRFLKLLTYKPAPTDEDRLTTAYYLLLQDRIEEALAAFAEVNPDAVPTRVQYDYCAAYLAMFDDDPHRARAIAGKHANHPVDRWRKLFESVANHLDEAEGKGAKTADPDDRDQRQAKIAASEPSFDAAVEGKAVALTWQNVDSVRVNYYLMDVELLFSTSPFVQQAGGQFAYIRPNRTQEVKLPAGQTKVSIPLPEELVRRNVMVEITAAGKTRAVAYYATAMDVKLTESYGQVKATDAATGRPLAKVYVKTYVRGADGRVKFHKDGYTDHRGRFDYASVSTPERVPPQRYAVLVLSDTHGATIREAAPPQQ